MHVLREYATDMAKPPLSTKQDVNSTVSDI